MKRQEREQERTLKADTNRSVFGFFCERTTSLLASQLEMCILFKVYCICIEYSGDISARLCFLHENSGFIFVQSAAYSLCRPRLAMRVTDFLCS